MGETPLVIPTSEPISIVEDEDVSEIQQLLPQEDSTVKMVTEPTVRPQGSDPKTNIRSQMLTPGGAREKEGAPSQTNGNNPNVKGGSPQN